MNSKTRMLCGTIILSLVSREGLAAIVQLGLPQLVHEAPMIVKGSISMHEGEVFIDVEKTLKGREHQRLQVRYSPWFEVSDPRFEDGEAVLLFLTPSPEPMSLLRSPDLPGPREGEMYLLGFGDQAKWPRVYPEQPEEHKSQIRYSKLLEAASLDDIEGIVAKLLLIEEASAVDDKVAICISYLRIPEPSLQCTIMRYVEFGLLWPRSPEEPSPQISHEQSRMRLSVRRQFSREVLERSLQDANEPDLRRQAVSALRYAHFTEAIPQLIERITDDDSRVQTRARGVLRTLARELHMTDAFATSVDNDSPEHLRTVQQQWQDWWQNNRARLQALEASQENAANESDQSQSISRLP